MRASLRGLRETSNLKEADKGEKGEYGRSSRSIQPLQLGSHCGLRLFLLEKIVPNLNYDIDDENLTTFNLPRESVYRGEAERPWGLSGLLNH